MTVTLRERRVDDEPFLRGLFASTRETELAALPSTLAETFIDQQFAAQDRQFRATYPDAVDRIICRGAEPIGRFLIDRSQDHIRLVDVALIAAERGRGVGSKLIGGLCSEADRRGVAVHLSVVDGNPVKNLYERLGFVTQEAGGVYSAMTRVPRGKG